MHKRPAKIDAWQNSEVDTLLGLILGGPEAGLPASAAEVRNYRALLAATGVILEGWLIRRPERISAVAAGMVLPGRTGLIQIPDSRQLAAAPDDLIQIIEHASRRLQPRAIHYTQVLAPTDDEPQRTALEAAGFRRLAKLIYLRRGVVFPYDMPTYPSGAVWRAYDEATEADFVGALEATHQESRDCPELSGVRPMNDILAAHRAAGPHDAQLWQLLTIGSDAVGCVLLSASAMPHNGEIVYMGLAPAFRGRGLGSLLLKRALELARQRRMRDISLAVDERNDAARWLYDRFGFREFAVREAYWQCGSGVR